MFSIPAASWPPHQPPSPPSPPLAPVSGMMLSARQVHGSACYCLADRRCSRFLSVIWSELRLLISACKHDMLGGVRHRLVKHSVIESHILLKDTHFDFHFWCFVLKQFSSYSVCTMCAGYPTYPTCYDGIKNGMETDVDCGSNCSPCLVGKKCKTQYDCLSALCTNGVCKGVCVCVCAGGTVFVHAC